MSTTGMALTLLAHAGVFNKAPVMDEGQVPTLLFIATENTPMDLYLWLYRYLRENDTGLVAADTGPIAIQRYVRRVIGGKGWILRILSVDPALTDPAALATLLRDEAESGFVPGLVVVDPGECIGPGSEADTESLKEFVQQYQSAMVVTEPLYRTGPSEGPESMTAPVQPTPLRPLVDRRIHQQLGRGETTAILHLLERHPEGDVTGEILLHRIGGARMVENPL